MELEQLRHFLKVAELENITRAAEAIGLSQSALSRSITRLEEELGQPLFERQTRRVTLTDAGQMLNDRALKIVQLADDTKAEIYDDGLTGRLRIGAIPTIAPYFLPECLRVFRKQCPQAQLIIQEETTENLLRSLTHGELDIGIAALPVTSKYLSVHRLFDEECWLVTAPDHPMAQQGEVHIRDLEGQPLVLLSEAHCLSSQIISFCQKKSITPVMVERASQLAMVLELVALGHGISLIPEMARVRDTGQSRVYRSFCGKKLTRTIAYVINPYRYQSKLARKFQDFLANT